jgi:hypothetical protein
MLNKDATLVTAGGFIGVASAESPARKWLRRLWHDKRSPIVAAKI